MKKTITEILILLILTSSVIFFKFNQLPKNLAKDEVEIAKLALSLDNESYVPFSTLADGHATLYPYLMLLSFKIFGVNNFALRLPSAVSGIGAVLTFYIIMGLVSKDKILAFFLSALFLSTRWFFNFPRFSFEMPFLLFLELCSLFFVLFYEKSKKTEFLLLSALFAGLSFNSYQPGRIFFLVPLFALLLKRDKFKNIFLFIITFILLILPLSFFLLFNQSKDIRINQQLFFKNSELPLAKKLEFFGSNVSSTLLMFNFSGDTNGRHNYPGKPALNPIVGLLFIFGLIIAMKQWSNVNNKIFLIYFAISLIPTFLTYPWENPNMLRTYTAIPSIIYFVGRSIIFISNIFRKFKFSQMFYMILFIILFTSAIYDLRTYFIYQPGVSKNAFVVVEDLGYYLRINKIIK